MQSKIIPQSLRRALTAIVLVAIMAGSAAADDYAKALEAYEAGRFATVIQLLEPLAKASDPRAQYLMGRTHEWANSRDGVKRDLRKALIWYERAAKQDYLPAKRALGRVLAGEGIDTKRGYRILLDLAEKGDVRSQTNLGAFLIRKGDPDRAKEHHLPGTSEEGFKWLRRAANSKDLGAMWHLLFWHSRFGSATKIYYWQIVYDIAGGRSRMSTWPDIRDKLTNKQIATVERKAAAWLEARGYTYKRLDPPRR